MKNYVQTITTASLAFAFVAFATACTSSKPPSPKPTTRAAETPAGTNTGTQTGEEQPLGTTDDGDATKGTGTGTGTSVDLTPDCDADKDFHKLEYPEKVKDCLKQEKLYNFDEEDCTTMTKAAFDCNTYEQAEAEIKNISVSTSQLTSAKSKGLKIIGCGSSNDGETIVTQHWQPSSDKKNGCEFSKAGKVVSLCFRRFLDGTSAPSLSTAEDKRKYLVDCMKE